MMPFAGSAVLAACQSNPAEVRQPIQTVEPIPIVAAEVTNTPPATEPLHDPVVEVADPTTESEVIAVVEEEVADVPEVEPSPTAVFVITEDGAVATPESTEPSEFAAPTVEQLTLGDEDSVGGGLIAEYQQFADAALSSRVRIGMGDARVNSWVNADGDRYLAYLQRANGAGNVVWQENSTFPLSFIRGEDGNWTLDPSGFLRRST